MKRSQVFNTDISSGYMGNYPALSPMKKRLLVAGLFEQLMLFDKAIIRTNGSNHGLIFLIDALGIETVERLLDYGYINLLIWTPVIVTGGGMKLDDGSIDKSVIYEQPPIVAGSMSDDDMNPEDNILKALKTMGFSREKTRSFIKKARKQYVVPDGMEFSTGSAKLVINAYENNDLESLGLPCNKPAMQMSIDERRKLLGLSSKVLETAVLSKYDYKSFENFESFQLGRQSLQKIGKAYSITENAASLFSLEKMPNLKALFLEDKLQFDSLFSLRHTGNAKYFRKWLNQIERSTDVTEITTEYLNELKGRNKITASDDKLMKTMSISLASAAIGAITTPPIAVVSGVALSLFDSFLLDNLIKGKNPSMFIEDVKQKIG